MTFNKSKLGLVHIYTGDGKGKTTAGMGLVVRALGRGLKVKIIQLFKRDTGEQYFFENSSIPYIQFKPLHPYFKKYDETQLESLREEFKKFWSDVTKDVAEYDLVLIDEIWPGVKWGVIDKKDVIDLIKNKGETTELVLTGRDFPEEMTEYADYIHTIKKIKHPYDKGILAREGIEY